MPTTTTSSPEPRRPTEPRPLHARGILWWGLAVLALILGFADLWRGGVTVAPLLLVVAYCVLIPMAILKE